MTPLPVERRPLRYAVAAWLVTAVLLVAALKLHLLPALFAGLLVYELVHIIAARLSARDARGKLVAVGLIATAVVAVLALAMVGIVAYVRSDSGGLGGLLQRMAEILEASRGKLPDALLDFLPADGDALKDAATTWLREHAKELRTMGGEAGLAVVHIAIGMVVGGMVSLREAMPVSHRSPPLSAELLERATRLGEAFRRIVFAQVQISLVNTGLTAIYLLIVLPLLGIHLPFVKTLVAVTFLAGLLPVVGNLISNTVILVVSLSVSLEVAVGSLAFLVIVHKLEYFLNARIVGSRINSSAWELLLAMLVMEAAFGLPGLVAAPVYYAYLKDELAARGLV